MTSGDIRRLLINVPPGCMKSLTTNVFWPAWEWGPKDRADLRYVGSSYSEALTIRDNRRCRHLIQSEVFQRLWGDRFQLAEDQNAKLRYDTSRHGWKIATSVGGMATGERGDRFIIDDPHNVIDGESEAKRDSALQWFSEVVPTRLNDPDKSAIVVIMQRVHDRDVSGLILAKELGYEHLCLPMEFEADHPHLRGPTSIGFQDPRREDGELLWPERFSAGHLEKDLKPALRAFGGDYAVAGQLQQRPAPRGGGMFKRANFDVVDTAPPRSARRCRGWDLAATKDGAGAFTVGCLISVATDGRVYIEDVVRGRWGPKEVEDAILSTATQDGFGVPPSLPQDPGQAGKAQRATLSGRLHGFRVHFSPETGSKEDRARPLAAQVENGNVALVRAPWNTAFLAEAETFPMGAFKDQIDAATRAYAYLVQNRPQLVAAGPELVRRGS